MDIAVCINTVTNECYLIHAEDYGWFVKYIRDSGWELNDFKFTVQELTRESCITIGFEPVDCIWYWGKLLKF